MIKPIEHELEAEALPLLNDLAELLASREAINEQELVLSLATSHGTLQLHLQFLIQRRQVECLRPVSRLVDREPATEEPPAHRVFYRWKRATDQEHVWQKELMDRQRRRCPVDNPPFSEYAFNLRPEDEPGLILQVLQLFVARR